MEITNIKWSILIISALTDTIITAVTGLTSAMLVMGDLVVPNNAVLLFSLLGGLLSGARTIQQGLKASIS